MIIIDHFVTVRTSMVHAKEKRFVAPSLPNSNWREHFRSTLPFTDFFGAFPSYSIIIGIYWYLYALDFHWTMTKI